MPPRRRGKATARAAAIQAVQRKRRQQQEDGDHGGSSSSRRSNNSYHHHNYEKNHAGRHNYSQHGTNEHADIEDEPPLLEECDGDDNDEDDENVLNNDSGNSGGCLHCRRNAHTDIQVRCDECQAYICQNCHWCHEFQANHEIRVCDRCDAFYCRTCDEMDQCDDCGEVVCASCSTLLSCKFCGGGLCEECATACGRCGIVLCSRDAKFAVDCDTCRLSYCLVCLASGSKDPCVRCGHRPSKRMEQLVHLRLKSIYKAFKQSSRAPSSSSGGTSTSGDECERANICGDVDADVEEEELVCDDDCDEEDIAGENPQVLLQAAASAASKTPPGNNGKFTSALTTRSQAKEMVDKYMAEKEKADAAAAALLAELDEEEEAVISKKKKKKRKKERHKAKREERTKKDVLSDEEDNDNISEEFQLEDDQKMKPQQKGQEHKNEQSDSEKYLRQHQAKNKDTNIVTVAKKWEIDKASLDEISDASSIEKITQQVKSDRKEVPEDAIQSCKESDEKSSDVGINAESDHGEEELCTLLANSDIEGLETFLQTIKGVPGKGVLRKNAKKALKRLRIALQEKNDQENLLKAESLIQLSEEEKKDVPTPADASLVEAVWKSNDKSEGNLRNKDPANLLKVISHNHHLGTPSSSAPKERKQEQLQQNKRSVEESSPRPECVQLMTPLISGWIIRMGGQRVRRIMDETGAKIWIDQDSMSAQDPRVVYISGHRKSVEVAIRMVKDFVENAKQSLSSKEYAADVSSAPADTGTTIEKNMPPSNWSGFDSAAEQARVKFTVGSKEPELVSLGQGASNARNTNPITPDSNLLQEKDVDRLYQLQEKMIHLPQSVHEMTCEARFVPLLIGRRGWTIKHIQDSSGARVDIDQSVTPRKIKISGKNENVRSAIRMVRDVLSYPLAQLQGNSTGGEIDAPAGIHQEIKTGLGEVATPISVPYVGGKHESHLVKSREGHYYSAAVHSPSPHIPTRVEGTHSSPPSSLIMASDAKSTISASSSLSSTPEPSMASSKGHAGRIPGQLLPHDYANGVHHAQLLPSTTNVFNQSSIPHGNISEFGVPLFPNGVPVNIPPSGQCYPMQAIPQSSAFQQQTELDQQQQQNMQPSRGVQMIREHRTQPSETSGHVVASHLQMAQHPPQYALRPDLQPNVHHSGSVDFNGSIPNPQNGMYLHQQNRFHPMQDNIYPQQNNPKVGASLPHNMLDNKKNNYANSGENVGIGMWGRNSSSNRGSGAQPMTAPRHVPLPDDHRLNPVRGATESHQKNPRKNTGMHSNVGIISETSNAKDDSRMVDSLFGPTSNQSVEVDDNILKVFQGLSLNGDGVAAGNVWGSDVDTSGIWDKTVDNKGSDVEFGSDQMTSSALLAAIQPNLSHEPQHPSKSRFIWGTASNESR